MSLKEFVLSVVSLQFGLIIGLLVLVGRLREKVARMEEWMRLEEKRINGKEE